MNYKQIKAFNKGQTGERLLCLKYARLAFGIAGKYDDAYAAWNGAQKKHKDRNLPSGVAVPVFWDYTTTIDGVRKNYGHVAVYLDGKVYSNPGKNSSTNPHVFNSIDEITKYFGLGAYLGWTEELNGVRVVEEIKSTVPTLELGRYQFVYDTNVRTAPNRSATIRTQYKKGEILNNPKRVVENDGHLWLNYTSNSGIDSYVAVFDIANNQYFANKIGASGTTPAAPAIAVGDMVLVKQGAKAYNGVNVSSAWYTTRKRVDELKGDRAVLDVKGWCTAFNVKDLVK